VVVIFAREDDRHAAAVSAILRRDHGRQVTIVDLSLFPSVLRVACTFSDRRNDGSFVDGNGRRVPLDSVTACWWRRPQGLQPDARLADARVRQFAVLESQSGLYGLLRCWPGLWVNDIENDQNADFKPRQLAAMRRLGLRFPETLVTNDPDEARSFFDRHNGDVVYKAFNQTGVMWLPTRRLLPADLAALPSLQFAPVIFQRFVDGPQDIRVTVVGEQVFATEFVIADADCIDHRLVMASVPCIAHTLPPPVAADALRLVRALGLEYGSIDLRIMPDGAYVFFEINTAGEFLYLEERTGRPIAAAVAAHLASGRPACAAAPAPAPAFAEET
jgi:hypothetical protein